MAAAWVQGGGTAGAFREGVAGLGRRLEKVWRDKPISVKDAFSPTNRARVGDEARVAQAVLRALELRRESVSDVLRSVSEAALQQAASATAVTLAGRVALLVRLHINLCRLAGV